MTAIASTANPRVKSLVRLRTRRERDATGSFLIDGAREVTRALDAGVEVETVYVSLPDVGDDAAVAVTEHARAGGVPVVGMAAAPFRRVSYGQRERGVLAVARQFPTALANIDLPDGPLVLVVEGVEKPGNLGAMLRTAAAAGVDAVVVADAGTDLFNPNVIRASLGAVFDVPVALADAASVRGWLKERSIGWYASSAAGSLPLWSADLTGAVAVVVGAEERGLDEAWLTDPGRIIHIPTTERQRSLNAAMAAGLLIYEGARQRRGAQGEA